MRTAALMIGLGVALAASAGARADDSALTNAAPTNPPAASEARTNAVPHGPARTPSERVIQDVTGMLQAGVSKEVVKAYVERLRVPYLLSAAEIISLKQQSVPDEILTAMVMHSGPPEGAAMADRARRPGGPARDMAQGRGLDPEGYDFWWYHYAYPRALGAANERVLSSSAPYLQGAYGSYPYLPFPPQPAPRWAPGR